METFQHRHEPTPAQKSAGNYKKKHVQFAGMEIAIENPAGTVRHGSDPSGKQWHHRQHFDYGYIKRTLGTDGDHVDCYLGMNEDAPFAYLITSRQPPNFEQDDEQKVMLGFDSEEEAVGIFLLHYDDERFLGDVLTLPIDDFKVRVCSSDGALIKGGELLFKALGAGERWITVHPNGEGTVGVPILIVEHPDGTASVIGGAAGKLNHLKLRGIKPQSSYREALTEKHRARQAARKEQIAKDKESGVYGEKQVERARIKSAMQEERDKFVKGVAELAGWDKGALEFNEEAHAGLSPDALEKARVDHKKDLFRRAKETVNLNRQRLIEDADARSASGLGTVPISTNDPDVLSVADLAPLPEISGNKLGFSPEYKERAGIDEFEVASEAQAAQGIVKTEEQLEKQAAADIAKDSKTEIKDKINGELDKFRLENPDTQPPKAKVLDDAVKAATMLKLQKHMKIAEQQARAASKALDVAEEVESKAQIIDVSDADVDEAARTQMEEDVRTAGTRAFLSAVEKAGGDSKIGGHIGTGAFNSLNSFSSAVGGDGLIDRSVVDVLGISGAAQVLARRIATDMGDDLDKVREAMELFHVEHYEKLQVEAVAKAQEFHDAAAAIELPDAANGADLTIAQAANDKRRQAVAEGQRVLGQAMGEMQANAALVSALQGKSDHLEVNLGGVNPEDAVIQLRAIGLQAGDYELEAVGNQLVANVKAAGMDRLAKPIDREGMAQVRRNLDIIEGAQDEDGWLPIGIAKRPDLSMHVDAGVAERLSKPFEQSGDLNKSLEDYIGGRMADGDSPVDILADVQSEDFFQKSGNPAAYREALENIAPLRGADGKMKPVETLRAAWEQVADKYVNDTYGETRSPIQKQTFDVDQHSVDALHRALAETPEGVAAYKQIGDLSHKERNGLRNWWHSNIAKEDPQSAEMRANLDAHLGSEPDEKESVDMFGDTVPNPEYQSWKNQRDAMQGQVRSSKLSWERYVDMLGSPEKAIETVQDLVRSHITDKFANTYNTLKPDAPLKIGKVPIRNALDHLDAVDPDARAARAAKEASLLDSMRERVSGKYAAGSVKDKMEQAAQEKQAFDQSQMGFFSTEDAPVQSALGSDERHTVGHAAEQKIAGMMSVVGQNFRAGKPTKLWNPSMSGGKNFARQRLIKMLETNKRVMAAFGTGSGKSLLQLSGFTQLHGTGKVKRGLILAPSIVQGQFGGEAVRYLEPGKYKIHSEPGASREERLAAYRDPSTHMVVATHQSFRDDMLHLGAKHAGVSESEMNDRLQKMQPEQRAAWAKSICDTEGFNFGYMSVDESQFTLNRQGKENSGLANVADAFSDNAEYYMPSSGDPVKNDASEIFDIMSKMDRKRYSDRGAFMRKYGGDTLSAKTALKREMARYMYPSKIDPDVQADRQTIKVPLNAQQNADLEQLNKDVSAVRIAKLNGEVAVDALKRIAPEYFSNVPEADVQDVAKGLQQTVGLMKNAATKRIIHTHPEGALLDMAASYANARRGKPGVIFAHSLESVEQLKQRLEKEGHRVVTLTGADSTADKDKKKLMFNPEAGDAKADIMIASDAGATGMNLQRGQWEVQMDTPDTAMTHGQRNGRIFRTGQKNDVELADFVADHPSVEKARDRLQKKYGLRELMTSPMEGLDDTGLAWYLKQKFQQQVTNG